MKYLYFIFLSLGVLVFSLGASPEKTSEKPASGKQSEETNPKWESKYYSEEYDSETTPLRLASMDILIPGYGMFELKKYNWSIFYLTFKTLGFVFLGLSIDSYVFWRPLQQNYGSLPNLNQKINIPGQGESTVGEIRENTEKSLLWLILSVSFQLINYGISFYHSYSVAKSRFVSSGSFYKIYSPQSYNRNQSRELIVAFGYSFHFE